MRTGQNFGLLYFLLMVCQVLLCNYFQFTPYAMLTLLPAMILCVPLTVSTIGCMFLALASGLAVDWLAEGVVGLNASALIPVALLRKPLIRLYFGEDLITRKDSFSLRKYGLTKVSAAVITSLAVFLVIYIFLDGAGTKPLWFNLTRGGITFLCSYLVSLIVINTLTPDDRK
jgi:hypothetical protein